MSFIFLFTTSTTTFSSLTCALLSFSFITCTFVSLFRAIALCFYKCRGTHCAAELSYHRYWLCLWCLNLVFAGRQTLGGWEDRGKQSNLSLRQEEFLLSISFFSSVNLHLWSCSFGCYTHTHTGSLYIHRDIFQKGS